MSHARNKAIIRSRLADGKSMTGVALNMLGDENANGMIETMRAMVKAGELITDSGSFRLPDNDSVIWDGSEPIPHDKIARVCRGRPNTVIAIGYTGIKKCYLNVGLSEAIERYKQSEGEEDLQGVTLSVVAFTDTFSAYDIGG